MVNQAEAASAARDKYYLSRLLNKVLRKHLVVKEEGINVIDFPGNLKFLIRLVLFEVYSAVVDHTINSIVNLLQLLK